MIFTETELPGAYVIDLEPHLDERGFFARAFCQNEFEEHKLNPRVVQCNLSYNQHEGTMRGMHLQLPPFAEAKLVRCVRGAIYDVVVDLRCDSLTYCQSIGVELTSVNRRALYVPEGFAHGFLTLEDETEIFYQMSEFYAPNAGFGFRYNDPYFCINWPVEVKIISEKDRAYPDFDIERFPRFANADWLQGSVYGSESARPS